jgi:tetratricopeptide (TPR) repeat protein
MSRKKEANTLLSASEQEQVQHLLEQQHQIAQSLHSSNNQAEAEIALSAINELPEAAQIALLKALSRVDESDAADILAAVNAFSPNKEVRKEARRSLIRLEATKTYPAWTPPIARASAIQVNIANPPRFWKGWVTQSRDQGEVQLTLAWEQGYDYSDTRVIGLLLDYWRDGVKDASVESMSKRQVQERIEDLRAQMTDIPIVDCTLAEGKRLLEEALTVNTWRGTAPHKDYRNNLPTINKLIFQASDPGEDRGSAFINAELTEQEVAINFLGGWSLGDYGLTYDLLSRDNAVAEGLSRDEWITLHRAWADESRPARVELGFVREREARQSALWVPTSSIGRRAASKKEAEIGWSVELTETPLSGTLPDMPMGTAVNKETGRHWMWTSYTLVQEQNAWRIQRITDEGAQSQGLVITDLQQRVNDYNQEIEAKIKQYRNQFQEFMDEIPWRLTQLLHYYDALVARLPLDRSVCVEAYNRAVMLGNPERTMVYLERLVHRFPEEHGDMLRSLSATQIAYAYSDRTQNMPERRNHFLASGEETLRQAIASENVATNHILLAELFLSMERNDEAEAELTKAQALHPSPDEEATIEAALGSLAMRRERIQEALPHFQRVVTIKPDYPGAWFSLGFAQRLLGNFDDAGAAYQRAIEQEPNDLRIYSELIAINMNRSDKQEARRIAEQGVQANPDSPELRALLASVLFELGDQHGALRHLEEAEAIDPEVEIVQRVRQQIQTTKRK